MSHVERTAAEELGLAGLPPDAQATHAPCPTCQQPTEVRFVLLLNDMRASKVEYLQPRAQAKTLAALERWYAAERVEPYSETDAPHLHNLHWGPHTWAKSFRKGGPLEWCNRPLPGNPAVARLPAGHPEIVALFEVPE